MTMYRATPMTLIAERRSPSMCAASLAKGGSSRRRIGRIDTARPTVTASAARLGPSSVMADKEPNSVAHDEREGRPEGANPAGAEGFRVAPRRLEEAHLPEQGPCDR
jgi:hypothetical protein